MTEVFGVDVAKGWVDAFGPTSHLRVANADLPGFAAGVAAVGGRVVFEASGGCEALTNTPARGIAIGLRHWFE